MDSALDRLLARPIAHRGLHERGRRVVENSFAAAEAAVAAGFGIECDIQRARDGEAMVFHDDTLDRLTEAGGRLDERPSAELAGIALRDSDDTIATLPAFLARVAGRVPLVIEIKARADGDLALADRAVALVATYSGAVALKSFDRRIMARCRELGAPCPLGLVGPDAPGAAPPLELDGLDFLSWNIRDLAATRARHPSVPLMSWTVRSVADQVLAQRHDARIVFEGFRPIPH